MKAMVRLIALAVLVAYPLLVFFGLQHLSLAAVAGLLALLLLLRALTIPASQRKQALPLVAVGLLLVALAGLRRDPQWLLFYPVAINLLLLLTFGASLRWPPTVVERIARLREPDLPAAATPYLRRVTQIWCLFFLANGTIALATVVAGDLACWTLYNGLISYLLIGALVAGEWLYRRFVLPGRSH